MGDLLKILHVIIYSKTTIKISTNKQYTKAQNKVVYKTLKYNKTTISA